MTEDRITHELNDYLSAIRGYCEVAKITHPYDIALVRGMDAAMESATRAAALIRQLRARPRLGTSVDKLGSGTSP